MRPRILLLALLMVASALTSTAWAQGDTQLWFRGDLTYKINKKHHLDFRQHLRWGDDISQLEYIAPDLSYRYRLKKFLRFRLGYRLIANKEVMGPDSHFDFYHRIYGDAHLRKRIKPITLKYRFRFQEAFGWPRQTGDLKFKHTIRNLIGVEWKAARRLRPFLTTELAIRLNDNDGLLHEWRITPGLGYRIKRNQFSLFYRYERMLNGNPEPNNNIIGLRYGYDLY